MLETNPTLKAFTVASAVAAREDEANSLLQKTREGGGLAAGDALWLH